MTGDQSKDCPTDDDNFKPLERSLDGLSDVENAPHENVEAQKKTEPGILRREYLPANPDREI
jgi:hypothetical protein